jgi:hypothetical protein
MDVSSGIAEAFPPPLPIWRNLLCFYIRCNVDIPGVNYFNASVENIYMEKQVRRKELLKHVLRAIILYK